MITDKDTERGAAGLLDLFRTVDSNTNGAAEAVVNEDINSSSQNVNNNNDNNVNVDRNDNNDNNNDTNDNDDMELEDESAVPLQVEIDYSAILGSEVRPDAEDDEDGNDEDGNDDDVNNKETPVYQTQKEIYAEVDIEINVVKKRGKVSIRCAKINPLAFIDIIAAGWEKLKKLDLVNTRFAAKERERRKQEIGEEVYENVMGNASGADTNTTHEGFARLRIS